MPRGSIPNQASVEFRELGVTLGQVRPAKIGCARDEPERIHCSIYEEEQQSQSFEFRQLESVLEANADVVEIQILAIDFKRITLELKIRRELTSKAKGKASAIR